MKTAIFQKMHFEPNFASLLTYNCARVCCFMLYLLDLR